MDIKSLKMNLKVMAPLKVMEVEMSAQTLADDFTLATNSLTLATETDKPPTHRLQPIPLAYEYGKPGTRIVQWQ